MSPEFRSHSLRGGTRVWCHTCQIHVHVNVCKHCPPGHAPAQGRLPQDPRGTQRNEDKTDTEPHRNRKTHFTACLPRPVMIRVAVDRCRPTLAADAFFALCAAALARLLSRILTQCPSPSWLLRVFRPIRRLRARMRSDFRCRATFPLSALSASVSSHIQRYHLKDRLHPRHSTSSSSAHATVTRPTRVSVWRYLSSRTSERVFQHHPASSSSARPPPRMPSIISSSALRPSRFRCACTALRRRIYLRT